MIVQLYSDGTQGEVLDNLRVRHPNGRERAMWHDELYQALGLDPKKHLPDAGLPKQQVGNVTVWVCPRDTKVSQDAARCWCTCPDCGKLLTAGKLHQHRKVHR